MPTKKSTNSTEIKVLMSRTKICRSVTRYDQANDPKAPSKVYVPNDALVFLGNPQQIIVTITSAVPNQ